MKCRDLISFIKLQRISLSRDEGFRFGDIEAEVTGILCCWKPTLDAIEAAFAKGCNLIITHEELNFPPSYSGVKMENCLAGKVTTTRLRLLSKYNITVFRAHSSFDRLCILDGFAGMLEFSNPLLLGDYWERIYTITPVTVYDIVKKIKSKLGLPYLRVVGNLDQKVAKVGLAWGGVSISANPYTVQYFLNHNVDVLIAGETEEIPMMACVDAGIAMIETGHAESENPGIEMIAEMIALQFSDVSVKFYANKRPWRALYKEGDYCGYLK